MNSALKLLVAFLMLIQLVFPSALAQGTTEVLTNIMTAFLGQLPQACYYDFGSPACMECMAIGKILPLALLTSLFFFAFYYVIKYTTTATQPNPHGAPAGPGTPSGTELRIAAAIGMVIGLLFLHTAAVGDALAQTLFWIRIGFVILIIMFTASMIRSVKGGFLWVIFAIIAVILSFMLWPQFDQITNYFTANCIS
jgi:hypothetical protein